MAQKRRGLGRGLQALIPEAQKEKVPAASRPSDVFFPDSRKDESLDDDAAAHAEYVASEPEPASEAIWPLLSWLRLSGSVDPRAARPGQRPHPRRLLRASRRRRFHVKPQRTRRLRLRPKRRRPRRHRRRRPPPSGPVQPLKPLQSVRPRRPRRKCPLRWRNPRVSLLSSRTR